MSVPTTVWARVNLPRALTTLAELVLVAVLLLVVVVVAAGAGGGGLGLIASSGPWSTLNVGVSVRLYILDMVG